MSLSEILKDFYLSNADVINAALSSLAGAVVGYITSIFRTRKKRLEETFQGFVWYDEDDLVFIDGKLVPLSTLTIVKKGKNADETQSITEKSGSHESQSH